MIEASAEQSFLDKALGWIEKAGNKVPHPAIIFLGLVVLIIVLSQVLAWLNVSVTYDVAVSEPPVAQEYDLTGTDAPEYLFPVEDYSPTEYTIEQQTTEVTSLLSIEGIRFIFTDFVSNFAGWAVALTIHARPAFRAGGR